MTHSPVIASTTVLIVHCWVCNHSNRDRGSRFCSARCREYYDSGAPIYDRRHTGKMFDVPLRDWKITAGPPDVVIGGRYYATVLDAPPRRQGQVTASPTTSRQAAARRDSPVTCATCGKTVEPHARPDLLLGALP